jgi:hypothetical protein
MMGKLTLVIVEPQLSPCWLAVELAARASRAATWPERRRLGGRFGGQSAWHGALGDRRNGPGGEYPAATRRRGCGPCARGGALLRALTGRRYGLCRSRRFAECGLSERTLRRAAAQLGLRPRKRAGGWEWPELAPPNG